MVSRIILWFNFGFITEKEATRLMVRQMLYENLTDNNKYTEIGK